MNKRSTARAVAGWILSVVPSMLFVFSAYIKLSASANAVMMFAMFGLPLWFMYFIGLLEIAGVAWLLFSRRPLGGVVILAVVAIGAAFEHLTHNQALMAPIAPVLALMAFGGVLLRQSPRPA